MLLTSILFARGEAQAYPTLLPIAPRSRWPVDAVVEHIPFEGVAVDLEPSSQRLMVRY